ncbi:MAG: ribosome maturation factor RimM [Bacteroidales bacterium]|nr:ribosome maturation factor RimM [Bacteroidales bacterium]
MQKSANILLPVAKVLKSFGTDGGVILRYNNQTPDGFSLKEPVFIYFDGLPVPFFISQLQERGNDQLFVKFETIDTLKSAEEIVGELVYISRKKGKKTQSHDETEEEIPDIIGFEIFEKDNSLVGSISAIYPYPDNLCIGVMLANGRESEVLIPLNEDFIIDVDIENEKIVLDLPKGILEL